MKALLHTFGTDGDLNPFVRLGLALQAQGDQVTLLVNPAVRQHVEHMGLRAIPCGPELDVDSFFRAHPEILGLMGLRSVWDAAYLPMVAPGYHAAADTIEKESIDVVVSHVMCLGSMWAAQQARVRRASLVLQPSMMLSVADPSLYSPYNGPRWLRQIGARGARAVMNLLASTTLGPVCKEVGVPMTRRILFETSEQQHLLLGMWSPRLRGAASDDPTSLHVCGFPGMGERDTGSLSPQLAAFLDAGPAPVVVGLGSSARNLGREIYASAAKACEIRGLRCVLVGADPSELPPLPDTVTTSPGEPYVTLFPRAHLLVHHGGMGTCAEALRAGRPSLIVPFFADQFDNADRCTRLGVARWQKRTHVDATRIAEALTLLDHADVRSRAAEVARAVSAEPDGVAVAARLLRDSGRDC